MIAGAIASVPVAAAAPPTWDRVSTGIQHLYLFNEGSGTTVADTGGSGFPANLIIPDLAKVSWIGGAGGLSITSPTRIETAAALTNFNAVVDASESVTMEVWITPANLTQNGPARIATISGDPSNRNMLIGQGVSGSTADRVEGRLRGLTDGNGIIQSAAGTLTTALTHVVLTLNADADDTERLFINSVERASRTQTDVYAWPDYKLAVGEEFGSTTRHWLGDIYLLALYSKGLSAAEVLQNYNAGATA